MQDLVSGLYTEDFSYGYPYDAVLPVLPAQFDYEGEALTSAGLVYCPRGDFALQYGNGSDNPDASAPYGGAPASNPSYMLFPIISWGQTVGMFLTVTTQAESVLTFDRAFSGYVGDRVSVVVNDIERISLTGTAGYAWTRSSITIGAGVNRIAFLLSSADWSSGAVVREGVSQSSVNVVDLYRFLRLTNLSLTNVAAVPTAHNQRMNLQGDTSLVGAATVGVRPRLDFIATSLTLWPAKLVGHLDLQASSSFTGDGVYAGKWATAALDADAELGMNLTITAHVASDTGGFGVGSSASLAVENPTPVDVSQMIRPLMSSSLTMTRPIFVNGRPVTPIAVSETEVQTSVTGAYVLSKVDPIDAPNNKLPVPSTYRWLSPEAHFDPVTGALTDWHSTDYANGPVWSTPGTYRPEVTNYAMKDPAGRINAVRYPAVVFDAAQQQHLVATLPAGSATQTWVFVGSFYRFRGVLADACPIIDFAGSTPVDYTTQVTAQRSPSPWADQNNPSIYLGLTALGSREPTISQLAYSSGATYGRTGQVVISDSTPVVIVYSLNGANSFVMVTPIVTGQNNAAAQMVAAIPRDVVDASQTSFTLAKSRNAAPFNGNFLTGSMSLLEVDYYASALSRADATTVSNFLVGLYTPTSIDKQIGDFTAGTSNIDSEQALIYAGDPEEPLALISGSSAVVTDLLISTPDGAAFSSAMNAKGVPTVLCTNRDYAALVATLKDT